MLSSLRQPLASSLQTSRLQPRLSPMHPELAPTRCLHARHSKAREKGALARVINPPGSRLQMLTPRCPALVPRYATPCDRSSAVRSWVLPASSCTHCPLGVGRAGAEPRSHVSSCFSVLRSSLLHARCQLGILTGHLRVWFYSNGLSGLC